MTFLTSPAQSAALAKLRTALYVCVGLGTVVVISAAGIAIQSSLTAQSTEVELAEVKEEISSLERELARAKKLPTNADARKDEKGLVAVQRFLKQSSRATGVELLEVQTGTSPMPFLTRYAKNSEERGKVQTDVQVNLRGDIRKIYALLVSLQNCPTGFEIDSIDISRAEGSTAKSAPVSAKLNMRIVTQEGG